MPDHKTKTFTYWRARFTPEPYNKTMQQLLTAAFKNTTVKERLWPPYDADDEENYFNFINHKSALGSYFRANFFGYERGRIGQVIGERFESNEIDPAALPAPKADDGTNQQFLDGKLYFVCFGNHLILAQDMHVKARRLESYLNTMFHNRCPSFPNTRGVLLERSISRTAQKQIKGVKRIKLSAPLTYNYGVAPAAHEQTGMIQRSKVVPLGRTWKAVKEFIGDGIDLTTFETDGFIDPKDIEVSLFLSWKRKRGEQDSDQMDALANTVRHVDDEMKIELETNSGKFKYNKLRLSTAKSVLHRNDMPDTTDIFEKMIEWYEGLIEAEEI